MIKFFRSIRKKLIDENKIGKYLKYAIGEIILVVLGILIALAINTLNENRKQANVEQEFIDGIKSDLVQDKAYILTIIELADEKDSLYNLLGKDLISLYDSDRARLDQLLQAYFYTQRTFYPISGSFQAAIASNQISQFRNKSFSAAVTKLYNSTYARLMDNSGIADNKWHYLTQEYGEIRRTGHLRDKSPEELNVFLDNIFNFNYSMNYYRNNLQNTVDEIDRLLAEY